MIQGCNVHLDWGFQSDPAIRTSNLGVMREMGCTAVRLDYAWGSIQPGGPDQWDWDELDKYMGEILAADLQALVMLYWAPNWASGGGGKAGVPTDPEQYGRVLGEIGARYGDELVGIEMWNEPDLDGFWAGSQAQFLDLLAEAYPVAKAMSPSTLFIAAAPTYLGLATDWYPNAYADSRFRPGISFDRVAAHPYMSPSDLPPWAPDSDWSIRGINDLQALRAEHGDETPLWITEFGWSTHANDGSEPNHKRGVTEAQQALYTASSFAAFRWYQEIEAAFLYTDADMPDTSDPQERNFGVQRTDWTPKPVVGLLSWLANAEPPMPEPPDPDLEARVAALELAVADLQDADLVLAQHLAEAAADLGGAS